MRIGIDARMYRSSVAGIGRYSQNLIKNLIELDQENEYVLFMTTEDAEEFGKLPLGTQQSDPSLRLWISGAGATKQSITDCRAAARNDRGGSARNDRGGSARNDRGGSARNDKACLKVKIIETDISHYSIAEQTKLPKIIEQENLDVMHFLNFNYPVRYRGKFITTIHDLTLFYFPATARKTNIFKRLAFKYVMKKACQDSSKIIAVSNSTKKDILGVLKVDERKIETIYEAADDKSFNQVDDEVLAGVRQKYDITRPVILYVGQFRPHKNIPGLIRAFNLLKKDIDAQLVLIGKADSKYREIWEEIDKGGFKKDIIMPGFVENRELSAWYKIAKVFVFPSFYEGFGLPGLEAMQAGTPVVSSNKSSLPEIFKDAALYFDPLNPTDISDKIKEIIQSGKLREDLIKKGKIVAANYSWKKTASETLEVYKQINSIK